MRKNIKINSKTLPKISFCIATYNAEKTLNKCLRSIDAQDYPKNLLELIIADGGSTDKTLDIAIEHEAKVISVAKDVQGAEYNKGVAINRAKNELLMLIDQDNILPHKKWLRKMVEPLINDSEIVAVEPLRYKYSKDLGLMDRYFALFGVNDPLPYYLGKADRLSYHDDKYRLFGKYEDCGNYYKVEFLPYPDKIPTLGANGFLIRRKTLMKYADAKIGSYLHIDVNVDLIKNGFNKYAFIKDTIRHETNSKGLITFVKRRKYFMEKYHLQDFSQRRYSVFMFKQDFWKLIYFVFISLTFVIPTFDALRGYLVIRDMAWFVHPILCFGMTVVYSFTMIKFKIFEVYEKFLEK